MECAEEKLSKAATQLTIKHPAFAYGVLRMDIVEDNTFNIAATDGKRIYYNKGFIESLNQNMVTGVLAHEVTHVLLNHHTRLIDLPDRNLAQIAADLAINGALMDVGFSLPPERLYDPKYANMSAEQIFWILYKEQKKSGKPDNDNSDPGRCGMFIPPKGKDGGDASKQELQQAAQEAEMMAVQAAAIAGSVGKLPGILEQYVTKLKESKIDWRYVIREFLEVITKSDYCWERPNRSYVGGGMYLPSLYKKEVGGFVVAVDSSGSIDDELFGQFISEVQAALDQFQPQWLRVIQADSVVQSDKEYLPGDTISGEIHGRGGTLFQPVFDYVEINGYQPSCLIYMTDMNSADTPKQPDYPVLWVSYDGMDAPWGDIVIMER